jgi:DNA invertase Pin-like site-specific DNA recombinase
MIRPGIQKLMQDAAAKKFDVVIAEALDRLSRDQEDVAGIYMAVMPPGKRQPAITLKPSGRMLWKMRFLRRFKIISWMSAFAIFSVMNTPSFSLRCTGNITTP